MQGFGLIMLGLVGAGAMITGLPIFVILLGVSCLGGVVAMVSGLASPALLAALAGRLVGMLESDILQALPLFVAMGALLNGLPLARTLYRAALALFGGGSRAAMLAGLALGVLISPMNGSASANAVTLSRVLDPALTGRGVAAGERVGLIAFSSTLGVLLPPSLVLILLGDAMMAAHTIAVNSTGRYVRILNTQDVFHGALLPALLVLGFAVLVTLARGTASRSTLAPDAPLTRREWIEAGVSVAFIPMLLGGVALGLIYAVEAAAMGAVGLALTGLLSGALTRARTRAILDDTIAMTGALFALLMAATSFTLVFRIFGTDALIAQAISAIPGGAGGAMIAGLLMVGLAGFVLDAFEIIFVLVPLIMPSILMRVEDGVLMAVLTLMVLQMSFLMPPLGYALVMTRAEAGERTPLGTAVRAVLPYLGVQALVVALVVAFPALTGRKPEVLSPPKPSESEVSGGLKQIFKLPLPEDMPPPPKF